MARSKREWCDRDGGPLWTYLDGLKYDEDVDYDQVGEMLTELIEGYEASGRGSRRKSPKKKAAKKVR